MRLESKNIVHKSFKTGSVLSKKLKGQTKKNQGITYSLTFPAMVCTVQTPKTMITTIIFQ
jgi:hypothetical protein